MQQIFIDGVDYLVCDVGDFLQFVGEFNEFVLNVGLGVFFVLKFIGFKDKSFFYVGVGINQILLQDVVFCEMLLSGNLECVFYGNVIVGYCFVGNVLMIELLLWFNLVGKNISNS